MNSSAIPKAEQLRWPEDELYPPYVCSDGGSFFCQKNLLPDCIRENPLVPCAVKHSMVNMSKILQQEHLASSYAHPFFPRIIITPPLLMVLSCLPDAAQAEELHSQIQMLSSVVQRGAAKPEEEDKLRQLEAKQRALKARTALSGGGKKHSLYNVSTTVIMDYIDLLMNLLCTQVDYNSDVNGWAMLQVEIKEICKVQLLRMYKEYEAALREMPNVMRYIELDEQVENRIEGELTHEQMEQLLSDDDWKRLQELDVRYQSTYIWLLEDNILHHLGIDVADRGLFRCRFKVQPLDDVNSYAYLNRVYSLLNGSCNYKNAVVSKNVFPVGQRPEFRNQSDRLSYPSKLLYVGLLSFLYRAPVSEDEDRVVEVDDDSEDTTTATVVKEEKTFFSMEVDPDWQSQ